jgi:hypothetical protein
MSAAETDSRWSREQVQYIDNPGLQAGAKEG